jgi:hypothetical protein
MIPYSAEAFFDLLATYNSGIWPVQLTALFLSILLLVLLLFPRLGGDRIIAGFLACGWAWTGLVFLMNHLITLNWAGTYFGMVFVLQAGLFLWSGTIQSRLKFRGDKSAASWLGLVLILFTLIVYPLIPIWSGYDWTIVQVAGLTPTPTVILTFGILLLCANHLPTHLLVIPVVWSGADGATAWTLGIWWDLFLPVAGLATLFFFIVRSRHDPKPSA